MACARIVVTATQYRIYRGDDCTQALPVIAFGQRAQFLPQLFLAFVWWPFPASAKVPLYDTARTFFQESLRQAASLLLVRPGGVYWPKFEPFSMQTRSFNSGALS